MLSLLCATLLSLTLASSVYGDVANSTAAPPLAESGPPPLIQTRVFTTLGGNATLPCRLQRQHQPGYISSGVRIKWTKVSDDDNLEEEVLVSMGFHKKSYNSYNGRVSLREEDIDDGALIITDVKPSDQGKFRCEVINGIDDDVQDVTLEVQGSLEHSDGVVFPYSPRLGRYNLNFHDAEKACEDQGAVLANFDQLYEAWRAGLDWCNAGWLNDGSVQYPITNPRGPCGGTNNGAGLRNYGRRDKTKSRYDAFCFTQGFTGEFKYLEHPMSQKYTFDEAVQACQEEGAEIATVGHMFAAWKLLSYDRCDAGWLADGSVRYPISRPRKNCSPTEAAVRNWGFPDKSQKFGVYCYKA